MKFIGIGMNDKNRQTFLAGNLNFGEHLISRERGFEERFLQGWDAVVKTTDQVILLGNIAQSSKAYWFGRIAEMPGNKVLLLGDADTNKERWYLKFGFRQVIPFNQHLLLKYYLGHNGEDKKEPTYESYEGNIMLSHLPSYVPVMKSYNDKYLGLVGKFQKAFDHNSCILGIHAHTEGKATERHNTFDASLDVIGEQLVSIDQVFARKYRRVT